MRVHEKNKTEAGKVWWVQWVGGLGWTMWVDWPGDVGLARQSWGWPLTGGDTWWGDETCQGGPKTHGRGARHMVGGQDMLEGAQDMW